MNILYLAPIPFGEMKQRPQYIAEELSKNHDVYYIEPTVSGITKFANQNLTYKGNAYDVSEHLHVIKLNGMLALPFRLKFLDKAYLFSIYEYIQLKQQIETIDVIWVGYPGWYDVLKHYNSEKIVYDIMDDYVQLTQGHLTRIYIEKADKKLKKDASRIITSAKIFYQKLKSIRDNVFWIPNALPDEYINNYDVRISNCKKKSFCYVGMISEWFDNETIEQIASDLQNEVVLVGPTYIPCLDLTNVSYIGKVEKERVSEYIRKSDICLYPFRKSDFLDTINPVKIYEYLAFNKPVIARRSIETEQLSKYVYLYSDLDELQKILEKNLHSPFQNKEEYEAFVNENTWSNRGKKIIKILEAM